MVGTHSRLKFHPHRVYPRRTGLLMGASRFAGATEALLRWMPRIVLDTTPGISGDPGTVAILSTRLVVCGLPRSGTTYLSRAAEMFLDGDGAVWKSHDPFVGRDFLPWGIPVLITLRPPLENAISKAIFHEDPVTPTSLVRRLALMTAWYRVMAREPRHALLRAWDFRDLIADPDDVLRSTLHRSSAAPVTTQAVEDEVDEEDARQGVSSPQTHIPHPHRAQLRAQYEQFVEDAKVRRYLTLTLEAQERVRQNHSP